MIPFPRKKYSVIYADPPWSYRDKSLHMGGAEIHYSTLSVEDIMNLPVKDICKKDCMLFLWATCPTLTDAFMVIDAWGFKYKTVAFAWVKITVKGKPLLGMGHWTRSNIELCLLGVKGHPKRVSTSVGQVVMSRRSKHSAKPDEVRDRIIQLTGNISKIELFARERVPGWDCWGNEVFIDREII